MNVSNFILFEKIASKDAFTHREVARMYMYVARIYIFGILE